MFFSIFHLKNFRLKSFSAEITHTSKHKKKMNKSSTKKTEILVQLVYSKTPRLRLASKITPKQLKTPLLFPPS